MPNLREKIIEILLKNKKLSREQLESALAIQKSRGVPLRKVLVDRGFVPQEELAELFSRELFVPTLHLDKYEFDPQVSALLPEQLAGLYSVIPLSLSANTLTLAVSDPLNILALDEFMASTGYALDMVLSPENEIIRAIAEQYYPEAENTRQPSTVKLVELMLVQALERRASDIHLEPEEDTWRVRYRIDGILRDVFKIPGLKQNAFLAQLKTTANLDITQTRIPQDARFRVKFQNREVDFRVCSLPTAFGQKLVLRLLDKSGISGGLDKLGFSEAPARIFTEAIARPSGMILISGPADSGKSTTLYSLLNQLNTPERNIISIEDPVEYQIDGVTQIQVNPDIGLDFASGLRSLLRQSPDVIMISEIRDPEIADIAVKAALSGQLVLSTLHSNDAISSIARIIEMGVGPFLAASSVAMLCAQRLCRKLCFKCRKPIKPPREFLERIGLKGSLPKGGSPGLNFYQPAGCSYCQNTGFYGRIAILEAVAMDDTLREMIIKNKPWEEIKHCAIAQKGMVSLRDDAFLKAQEGLISLEEALRISG